MLTHLLAMVALSFLCGAWVLVQRAVARHDPEAPTVEDRCGSRGGCAKG